MMEVELSRSKQARIRQTADEAFPVLAGHKDDCPPAMRVMAEFSLLNAAPQVGELRRRFFIFTLPVAALATAMFIGLYFGDVASQLFEQPRDKSIPLEKPAEAVIPELQQERQKNAALTRELATARRDFETIAELSRNASDETVQLRRTANAATAELQQERQKTAALTSELTAAHHDFETSLASSSKADDEAAALKKTAEGATAELRQERQKTAALTSELAAARRDFETKLALSSTAADEIAQVTAKLQREQQKNAALTSELATARQDFETKLASSSKAADETAQFKKSAEAANAELQQERQKTAALTAELATARRDLKTKLALLSKAADEAARLRKTAEAATAELQQERQANAPRMHSLESLQPTIEAPRAPERIARGQSVQAKPIATPAAEQPPPSAKKGEAARLMARANELLGQGNISAARIVLERAIEMGSAGASFAIAETYDPRVLSDWKTYGTRGDAAKAREFYEKAAVGGIEEAKDRLKSLR